MVYKAPKATGTPQLAHLCVPMAISATSYDTTSDKSTWSRGDARADEASALGVRNRPKREGAGEPLQFDFIVPLPSQFFVATGAQNVDIGSGLLAQPYLCPLDRPDDTSGEIHGSSEDIAFLDLQRTDMNAGPQSQFRRSRIGTERTGIVKRGGDRAKRCHNTIADGTDFVSLVIGDELSTLREVGLPDFIHAFVPHPLAQRRRIHNIGKDDRQGDPLIARPFDEPRAIGFGIGRQYEGLKIPLAIGG